VGEDAVLQPGFVGLGFGVGEDAALQPGFVGLRYSAGEVAALQPGFVGLGFGVGEDAALQPGFVGLRYGSSQPCSIFSAKCRMMAAKGCPWRPFLFTANPQVAVCKLYRAPAFEQDKMRDRLRQREAKVVDITAQPFAEQPLANVK